MKSKELRRFLLAYCAVILAPGVGLSFGQNSTQQGHSEAPETLAALESDRTVHQAPIDLQTERSIYGSFMNEVGSFDLRAQKQIAEGGPEPARTDFVKLLHIQLQDEELLYSIVLQGFYAEQELDRQIGLLDEQLREAGSAEQNVLSTQRDALNKKHPLIIDTTVDNLKSQLSEQTFSKLNAYLCQQAAAAGVVPAADASRPDK